MKELPKAIEAEQAIISTIFVDPERAMPILDGYLDVDDFYSQRHKVIYKAARSLFIAGSPIDVVSVAERLTETAEIERAGGHVYLGELIEKWATTEAVEHYASIVRSKAWRRRLISCGARLSELGYVGAEDDAALEERVDGVMKSVVMAEVHADELVDLRGMGDEYLEKVGQMRANRWPGVGTGFRSLDKIIRGLEGQLAIVAGSPSMGKSMFMLNMAYAMAKHGTKVGILSFEMTRDPIEERLIQRHCNWGEEKIRYATIEELRKAANELSGLPLWVSVSSTQSVTGILEKMRRMVVRNGIQAIFLDYLQLLGENTMNRAEELSGITRRLLLFAKKYPQVAVIAGAQINRQALLGDDKRPRLHHLKSSGGIEEHGDIVLGLFREEYADYRKGDSGIIEVHVLKNRTGKALTMVKMACDVDKQRIADLTGES